LVDPDWIRSTDGAGQSASLDETPVILRRGCDGVTARFTGRLRPDLLKTIKDRHRPLREEFERCGKIGPAAPVRLLGVDFFVKTIGRKGMPYILINSSGDEIEIGPRGGGDADDPFTVDDEIRIRLSSHTCTTSALSELAALPAKLARTVLEQVLTSTMSRLDLAVDFQGAPLPREQPELWSTKMPMPTTLHRDEESRSTSLTFGATRTGLKKRLPPLSVHIEDATQEVRDNSGKEWLAALWAGSPGYDPNKPVQRVEVRLRRDVLSDMKTPEGKELKDASVEETIMSEGSLWVAALLKSCRLTVPTKGKQKSRRPTDPAWQTLAGAFGAVAPVTRIRVKEAVKKTAEEAEARDARRALNAEAKLAARLRYDGKEEQDVRARMGELVHMSNPLAAPAQIQETVDAAIERELRRLREARVISPVAPDYDVGQRANALCPVPSVAREPWTVAVDMTGVEYDVAEPGGARTGGGT